MEEIEIGKKIPSGERIKIVNGEEIRVVGFMEYKKCPTCGDLSYCRGCLGDPFCINQHRDVRDGNITQPISDGINMHGKLWEQTPEGKKWLRKQKK